MRNKPAAFRDVVFDKRFLVSQVIASRPLFWNENHAPIFRCPLLQDDHSTGARHPSCRVGQTATSPQSFLTVRPIPELTSTTPKTTSSCGASYDAYRRSSSPRLTLVSCNQANLLAQLSLNPPAQAVALPGPAGTRDDALRSGSAGCRGCAHSGADANIKNPAALAAGFGLGLSYCLSPL